MVLEKIGQPLQWKEWFVPEPGPSEILLRVEACAVCRTDLHVIDGELNSPKLPLIPGHEIVGSIVKRSAQAERFQIGERVGVPWLGWTCGECKFCRSQRENLCDHAFFTGYTLNGGYAEYAIADERFCFSIPKLYTSAEAAPLLCAGLIGYRCLRKTGAARTVGLFGFGAAAHIVTQIANFEDKEIYAFTRSGDRDSQNFALQLGAVWAGGSMTLPTQKLDAAIIFAPAGELIPQALRVVDKGGIVVCGGIHMSNIPEFPYEILWEERVVCSVANLTRQNGIEFMDLAPKIPIRTSTELFPLAAANEALNRLRSGKIQGAAVLIP